MKKALGVGVTILILLPVLAVLIPKRVTVERLQDALKSNGLTVYNVQKAATPSFGAVEEVSMTVNDVTVEFYRFDSEGKIAVRLEDMRPDAGQAIVDQMHLAEALGAAKPKNRPMAAARNGLTMLTATSEARDLNALIIKIFSSL